MPPEELLSLAAFRGTKLEDDLERSQQIRQIVDRMDEWTREAWSSRQCGYSWREIAEQCGMSEAAAKMRFRYALTKIRGQLSGRSRRNPAARSSEREE
jgi:DNA-directed RNA polymerase specialized sigma24 family protein